MKRLIAEALSFMHNQATDNIAAFVKLIQNQLRLLGNRRQKNPFSRNEYKAVWNSVSKSEEEAKFAICGSTDEQIFQHSAPGTVAMLKRCVGVNKDDVILEIGCGVGRVGAALAPICREWIGTDVSENMINHLRRRLAAHPNVRGVTTSGFDLEGIDSGSVDVVYCTVVFMHLEEWERYSYIKEGYRILRPGGRMLVDNINLASELGWKFFEDHRAIPLHERPPQISKTSTPQELETYFQRAGFTDIRHELNDPWVVTFGTKPDPGEIAA
jgi:SAM-dependent methyltransferase